MMMSRHRSTVLTARSGVTVIVSIRHPRYLACCRAVALRLVRVLPSGWRVAVYWRLLDLVRAAPRFTVLRAPVDPVEHAQ